MHHASSIIHHASRIIYCRWKTEIRYVDCSHKYKMNQSVMLGGRQPLVEDTFSGRPPLLEDDLWWKTTMGERRPLVKEDLRWKMTFGQRRPSLDPCMLPTPLCSIFGQ